MLDPNRHGPIWLTWPYLSWLERLSFLTSCFLVVSPLLLWLAFYAAARWSSSNLRPIIPYLRAMRWVGFTLGALLFLISLVRDDFRGFYGAALLTFSAGLGIPEWWVKLHFAPELLPKGYWPRRPE